MQDDACEVLEAAEAGGWSPSTATDALSVIEVLVSALGLLGQSAADVLGPH